MKVTAAITKALKDKDMGILSGEAAMRAIIGDLHQQIVDALGKAALGSWEAHHLRQMLDNIEYHMANSEGKAKTALDGQLNTAWNLGKRIVDSPLSTVGVYMAGYHLPTEVLDAIKGYSNDYLKGLYGDAWYKIKGEITVGLVGGKTPFEVMQAIGKTLEEGHFKNFAGRAETITRHEMGTVLSEATQKRMEQAVERVPGIEKQWRHVGHPKKPRPSHLAANGVHVPVKEAFNVGGVLMMFPRDPGAGLADTMNCGCDHVPYHVNWQ